MDLQVQMDYIYDSMKESFDREQEQELDELSKAEILADKVRDEIVDNLREDAKDSHDCHLSPEDGCHCQEYLDDEGEVYQSQY